MCRGRLLIMISQNSELLSFEKTKKNNSLSFIFEKILLLFTAQTFQIDQVVTSQDKNFKIFMSIITKRLSRITME